MTVVQRIQFVTGMFYLPDSRIRCKSERREMQGFGSGYKNDQLYRFPKLKLIYTLTKK